MLFLNRAHSPYLKLCGGGLFLHPKMITSDNLRFIKDHRIDEAELFDATGLSTQEYRLAMTDQNKIIAYGVEPCFKGHSLGTRSGHCVHCNPARLTFIRRHIAPGQVYIAGSSTGRVIKIGSTSKKEIRQESLNRTQYGGFNDWEILCTITCNRSGEVEQSIVGTLEKYRITRTYFHEGRDQQTYELFTCGYPMAIATLKQVIEKSNSTEIVTLKEDRSKSAKYSFRNLTKLKP